MAANRRSFRRSGLRALIFAAMAVAIAWLFPLARVVPEKRADEGIAAFDAHGVAEEIWNNQVLAAAKNATALEEVIVALRQDPVAAASRYGHTVGFGVGYFFVQGSGRVVGRERNILRIAVDGGLEVVAVRIGPVFGNVIRDGCGLLDVNSYPGLEEFNALSAELNAIVDRTVTPALRANAEVGTTVQFAGCAEAPEVVADPGEPVLIVVPVRAEVQQ